MASPNPLEPLSPKDCKVVTLADAYVRSELFRERLSRAGGNIEAVRNELMETTMWELVPHVIRHPWFEDVVFVEFYTNIRRSPYCDVLSAVPSQGLVTMTVGVTSEGFYRFQGFAKSDYGKLLKNRKVKITKPETALEAVKLWVRLHHFKTFVIENYKHFQQIKARRQDMDLKKADYEPRFEAAKEGGFLVQAVVVAVHRGLPNDREPVLHIWHVHANGNVELLRTGYRP